MKPKLHWGSYLFPCVTLNRTCILLCKKLTPTFSPMKFWTYSESQIPFHQQMTTGPPPSATANFSCAYLMCWKCVSEWAQFCHKPQISDTIKNFCYLEFFMVNLQWWNESLFNYNSTSIFPSAYLWSVILLLLQNMLFHLEIADVVQLSPREHQGMTDFHVNKASIVHPTACW